MMRVVVTLTILLSVAYVYADNDDGGAIVYTEALFNEKITTLPHFVKFYAPWCGHCKRMAPAWEELGKKFNVEEDQQVVIAKVDCTVETKLCSDHGVKGYPTVKWFGDSAEGEKYSGARDINGLTSFVKVKTTGEGETEEDDKSEEAADPAKKVDGVWSLTGNSFKNHIAKGHHFVKFFAPWCGHCKSMAPAWIELGKDTDQDNKATINEVDCTAHKEVCTQQGVRGYPTIMWFTDGKMIEKYAGARDRKSLGDYVNKMVEGKPEATNEDGKIPAKKDEKPAEPAGAEGEVTVLTADNFADTIATGTTFVKFYAPWCGHCKRLVPTWEELGGKYKDNDKVTIAKIDCTVHKETCSQYEVKGYPTLILFRNGKSEGKHAGARNLEGLDSFLTSKVPHDEL